MMGINNYSQIFILTPLMQGFNSSITLHYKTKYALPVPVYSAPHTPNQEKSIKLIEKIIIFLTMLYFYYILLYFYYILYYSLQNYMCGHTYQDLIIKTHYCIVFYHFNNS